MRTVDYSQILHGSAALAGLLPDDLDASTFALLRTFHDRRLQIAWEIHEWPELCPTEQRTFRPAYDAVADYDATTEVYDRPTGGYYQSLQDANTGNAPTIDGKENSEF